MKRVMMKRLNHAYDIHVCVSERECVRVRACVFVCLSERERERESVCVCLCLCLPVFACVCVCVYEIFGTRIFFPCANLLIP
jgi:hypothetical protein